MPAVRLSRRRKSSHILFTPAKAGIYGISPRPVTFAPNVTPVTYVDSDDPAADLSLDAEDSSAALFPPSANPPPPPTRKRCPPGKRRSQGYIPRPPNAFMLFRADFVRQKHVPGSIETNHGSLSKIIGTCWRQLGLDEKRIWEVRAKQEKANHKAQFPDYRFRPVHNKNKNLNNAFGIDADVKRKEKPPATLEDERRCEEVAQLLLEGKKGEELAMAVRHLDREREREQSELEMQGMGIDMSRRGSFSGPPTTNSSSSVSPAPLHLAGSGSLHLSMPIMGMGGMPMHMPAPQMAGMHNLNHSALYMRRPSSVPLPNGFYAPQYGNAGGIAMPSLPFFGQSQSRPLSPVASISRQGFLNSYASSQAQEFNNSNNNFAAFQTQGDFVYPPDDSFAHLHDQHHQQQHQEIDPSFAFSNPFAPNQTLPLVLQPTPTAPTFSPGFGSGFGHPSLAQRNSLGLGRRASSAQAMLMRSDFVMPVYHSHSHSESQQPLERDHSPLPDVEPELFAPDFSFGSSSSSSSSTAGSANGSGQMNEGAVSPVMHAPAEVDPVSSISSASTVYDGSPSPAMSQAQGLGLEVDPGSGYMPQRYDMYGVGVGVNVDVNDGGMYASHMGTMDGGQQMWGGVDGMGVGVDVDGMGGMGMVGKGMEMEMGMGMGMEAYFEAGAF